MLSARHNISLGQFRVRTSASSFTAGTNAGVSDVVETVSNVPRGLMVSFDGMLETNDEKL